MLEAAVIDCVEGVEVERTDSGRIRFVRIDLDTHPFVVPILQERGLVNGSHTSDCMEDEFDEEDDSWLIPTPVREVDCRNIKWSKSMLQSFDDIENGRVTRGNWDKYWHLIDEDGVV